MCGGGGNFVDLHRLVLPSHGVVVGWGEVGVVWTSVIVGPDDDSACDLSGGEARLIDQVRGPLGEPFWTHASLHAYHSSTAGGRGSLLCVVSKGTLSSSMNGGLHN